MFGFHKPKMYRSLDGCCICRAKSSSSRFTTSQRYQPDLRSCFGLGDVRCGDICNACVLLVKRWKKLPVGSKKNWNHVVDTKGGASVKTTLKMKRRKKNRPRQNNVSEGRLKTLNSDAHSSSSTSPAQSPSYSNQSDEGSDTEPTSGPAHSPVFAFLDRTYWKRQRVCCGVVYAGRYGEVIIDPQLYKPCCRKPPTQQEQEEQQGEQEEEEEEEKEHQEEEEEEEEEEKQQQQQQEEEEEEQQEQEEEKQQQQQQEEEEEEEEKQQQQQQQQQQEEEEEEGHIETPRSSQLPQVKQEVSVEDRKERSDVADLHFL